MLCPNVLTQHYLGLVLQIFYLRWILQSSGIWKLWYQIVMLWDNALIVTRISNTRKSGTMISIFLFLVPGLKRAIAFRQANSAGSTCKLLNLLVISCSILISETVFDAFPFAGFWAWSGVANSGDVSIGMLHWIAHRRNNSAQDSSSKITWKAMFWPRNWMTDKRYWCYGR